MLLSPEALELLDKRIRHAQQIAKDDILCQAAREAGVTMRMMEEEFLIWKADRLFSHKEL